MEEIHKARIFDIAAGMGVRLDTTIRDVNARSLELIKRTKENFRQFIDSATPSIYPIDILNDVTRPMRAAYNIALSEAETHNKFVKALEARTTSISTAEFQRKIDTATKNSSDKLEVLQQGRSSHLSYRNVFYDLGKELAAIFPKVGVLLVSDPQNMGLPEKYVFIGRSFSNLKSTINDTINGVLFEITGDKKAYYGKVMAAGHTAIALKDGTYGTNTPATQEALFKIEASKTKLIDSAKFTDTFVRNVPLFVQNTITFSENFTPTAKTLLSLGFTFVVPMDSATNSKSGSVEAKAIRDIIGKVVLPNISDAMKNRLAWLKGAILGIHGSPSILDYITSSIVASLSGKQIATSVYTEVKKSKTKLNISIPTLKLEVSKKVLPSKTQSQLKTLQNRNYSLTSLQALINASLQHVIAANMGDGTQRKILNYRTGRFAASAQVVNMSQSREGMITAFYSYMKNPYQTFEPGFAQGGIATRDPKLLISKSIREIAATKVGNRLRAVSV